MGCPQKALFSAAGPFFYAIRVFTIALPHMGLRDLRVLALGDI